MTIDREDPTLEALFAQARAEAPGPELAARVLADAAAVQAGRSPRRSGQRGGSWFETALNAIGGWPGLSGAAAAGVVGLAIGLAAPEVVDAWAAGQISGSVGEVVATPDITAFLMEDGDV